MTDQPLDRFDRPAIDPVVVPILLDADTVQFRLGPWAGPVLQLRDRDGDGRLEELLDHLDGTHPLEEVLAVFGASNRDGVATVLEQLDAEGVLVDSADHAEDRAVHPSALRVSTTADLGGADVLIVAHGPLGRAVADVLVPFDLASIRIVTPFEEGPTAGGWPSGVDLLNPETALAAALDDVDAAVCAATGPIPELGDDLNAAALSTGTPWCHGQVIGLDGVVGPTVIPGQTACYRCYRQRSLATVPEPMSYRRYETAGGGELPAAMTAMSGVVAGLLGMDLRHLLAARTGFTVGRVVHVDFFDLDVRSNSVLRLPRCPACGAADRRVVDHNRHAGLDRLLEDAG